jgi:hypothetical protein
VTQFDLIGNLPVRRDGIGSVKGDYLSDHFGLLVKFDLKQSVAAEQEYT